MSGTLIGLQLQPAVNSLIGILIRKRTGRFETQTHGGEGSEKMEQRWV